MTKPTVTAKERKASRDAPAIDLDNDADRLVSVRQICALTNIARTSAYDLAASGAWEVVQTGRRTIRVRLSSVRAWIAANTRTAESR